MASQTEGIYSYIERTDMIPTALTGCLAAMRRLSARHLQLNIRPAVGVLIVVTHTAHPCLQESDGSVTITMHDLYAGESRDILLDLQYSETPLPSPLALFQVKCLFHQPDRPQVCRPLVNHFAANRLTRLC
jgi:hypothetical protein